MRAALLLLLFFVGFTSLQAQPLFEQDFESGIEPMILIDADGLTPAPNVSAYPDAWNAANPAFGNGTNVAVSNSWYSPAGQADDWMITPAIIVADSLTVVSWEAKAQDPTFPDGYEVRVSTSGTEIEDFEDVIFSIPNEETDFVLRNASLAGYVGDTIHIAWRNNSVDQFLLLVDNISVKALQPFDISATALTTSNFYELGEDIVITGEVENKGGTEITSLIVEWTDGVETYTDSISGISIPVGGSYNFSHTTPFQPTEAQLYSIEVTVSNPNGEMDGNMLDNTTSKVVGTVTEAPMKRMVMEEGTGTWCGWCPRGFVAMEYMLDKYPETFIGIAVHNQDPMVDTEYDNNIGLTGYPGCNADRVFLNESVSVDAFENYYEVLTREISPVAPSVSAVYDPTTGVATIECEAQFKTKLDGIDYRFAVVMLEDSVVGTTSGYDQVNFYSFQSANLPLVGAGFDWQAEPDPVPADRMVYDHVARAIIGGYDGDAVVPSSLEADEIVTQSYEYQVPASLNPEHMEVVLMVIDGESGAILNGFKAELDVLTSNKNVFANEAIDIFPNPTQGATTIKLDLDQPSPVQLKVFDMAGRQIVQQYMGTIPAGETLLPFDATQLPAGSYQFQVYLDSKIAVQQVIVK
jgi:hypothetical protein